MNMSADFFDAILNRPDPNLSESEDFWDAKAEPFFACKRTYGTSLTDRVVRYLSDEGMLGPGASVLDVGCAYGRYALPFAASFLFHFEEKTAADPLLKYLHAVSKVCDKKGISGPAPMTAAAGVAIVRRNFPFHIAYDLAEGLVSRGKKLGKKPGASPCSTIDFHVLRDTTVLDPEDTLDEYEGRTQRPFLVGHYAPERIGDATTASSPEATPPTQDQWKRILQAVAAFDGHEPDSPDKTPGDPFPRARANRIVKLLAEGNSEQAVSEWELALDTTPAARKLQSALIDLSAKENAEQVNWLLDLIDLSENLADRYIASSIESVPEDNTPKEAGRGHDEAVGSSSEGGDK